MRRSYTRVITTPASARAVRNVVRPFVSLLSDFGSRDPSAGICRAVVLGIAPDAIVLDISHDVAKFQVKDAALLLWCALPYLPVGAHVAVVDPGVGTERRPVALETPRGDVLIGPDNGLLLPAAERVGGVTRAHLLENHEYRLPVTSSSFHGRDVFAPAAAHVALGTPIEALGRGFDPAELVTLDWPATQIRGETLRTAVVYLDTFGNVKLAAQAGDLRAALGPLDFGDPVRLALRQAATTAEVEAVWHETFGRVEPGEPLLYEDSYGRLCLAVNQGSAVERFGISDGMRVSIERRATGPGRPVLLPPPAAAERPGEVPAAAAPAAVAPTPVAPADRLAVPVAPGAAAAPRRADAPSSPRPARSEPAPPIAPTPPSAVQPVERTPPAPRTEPTVDAPKPAASTRATRPADAPARRRQQAGPATAPPSPPPARRPPTQRPPSATPRAPSGPPPRAASPPPRRPSAPARVPAPPSARDELPADLRDLADELGM